MFVTVECRPDHRGDDAPCRLHLGDRSVDLLEVLDRWLAPDHGYFKVRGEDGAIYILRHDVRTGHWELWMYEKGVAPT
jgi:hypothetical protein